MKFILGTIVICLICGFNCLSMATTESEYYMCYDEFISAVDAGKIKSVRLNDYSKIAGTLRTSGGERSFNSYANTGAANDPLLLRFLKDKGVQVTLDTKPDKYERPFGFWFSIITFGIPIITLLFVLLTFWKVILIKRQKNS